MIYTNPCRNKRYHDSYRRLYFLKDKQKNLKEFGTLLNSTVKPEQISYELSIKCSEDCLKVYFTLIKVFDDVQSEVFSDINRKYIHKYLLELSKTLIVSHFSRLNYLNCSTMNTMSEEKFNFWSFLRLFVLFRIALTLLAVFSI